MKKLILLASCATLWACAESATEEAAEEVAEESEEAVEDAMMAPDGGPIAGSYEVTLEDGTVYTTTIADDGTYMQVMADGTTNSGTMMMQDEDTACFDDAADEEGPICYDSTIGEDGTWTSTGPEGSATVVRVES